jgi:N-acetylmuramoyl-L-alanine amidase
VQHPPYDSANSHRRYHRRSSSRFRTLLPFARTALLALLLVPAVPALASDGPATIHLRIAGKVVDSKAAPVDTGAEIYVPLDVLPSVGAGGKINKKQDAVTVHLGLNRYEEFALARFKGVPMMALSDLARFLNAEVFRPDTIGKDKKPIPGKKSDTIYLLARVMEARFNGDALRVTTSFPVPFHVRTLMEATPARGFVDCVGATVADDFHSSPLAPGEKHALRLRAGQYSVDTARIVVELADGVALKASDSTSNSEPIILAGLIDVPSRIAHSANGNKSEKSKPTRIAGEQVQVPGTVDGASPSAKVTKVTVQSDPVAATHPKPTSDTTTQTKGNPKPDSHVSTPGTGVAKTLPPPGGTRSAGRGTIASRGGKVKREVTPIEVCGLSFEALNDARCRLTIATTGRATASVHFVPGVTQMQLDIPNAFLRLPETETCDRTFTHPLVSGLHAVMVQETPPLTRITLDMERVAGFSINAQNDKLSLELRLPRNATGALADKVIVVDAGHGGSSTGAIGHGGAYALYEKDITLAIALKLRTALEACGARVVMTRDHDVDVPLYDRPHLANDIKADLFVSIHNDSNGSPNSASGTSTYYHMSDPSSRALATCVQQAVTAVTGLPSRGVLSDGIMYASGFAVLRVSTMPAILCEVAYINNSNDRRKLMDADFQQRVAQAICDGLRTYVEGTPQTARRTTPMTDDTKSDGDPGTEEGNHPSDKGNGDKGTPEIK